VSAADPGHRLADLLRDVGRHRDAIREFGLAGYVTMVEQHQARLRQLYDRIRRHCEEHDLELPPEVAEG
jgi:transposase